MTSNIEELLRAARNEAEHHNYDKALELGKELLQKTDSPGNLKLEKARIEILFLLADITNMMGNWSDSLMYLNMIKLLGEHKRSLPLRIKTTIWIADIFANTGKWDNALALYDEAANQVENFHNPKLMAQALVGKSIIYWRTGQNTFSINFGKKALDIAKEIQDDQLIGKCAAVLSNAYSESNQYDRSLAISQEAEDAYRRARNMYDTARVLSNRGEIHMVLEQYEEGILALETAITENLDWYGDNAFMRSLILINLATCQAKAGMIDEAERTVREANRSLEESEDKYSIAFFHAVKGIVASEKGDHSSALKSLKIAEEQILKQAIPYDSGRIAMEYAIALSRAGKKPEAKQKFKEAMAHYKEASSMDMAEKAEKQMLKI